MIENPFYKLMYFPFDLRCCVSITFLSNLLISEMAELIVPEYLDPTIKCEQYLSVTLCCLAILPNLYFLHRSICHKEFSKRKHFKYMTIIMSSEYIFASIIHASFNGYLIISYYTGNKIYVKGCSKYCILDLYVRQILIATPFYLHFLRFWLLIFNKKKRYIVPTLAIIIIITIGPLLYMMLGQFFEINIYFLPKGGCGYQIFSDIPFYIEIMYFNLFVVLALPFILIFINYLLYRSVAKMLYSTDRPKIMECKKILKGILLQGLFALIFQVPPITYLLYYSITRNVFGNFLDTMIHFIFYVGYILYVFFTVHEIKDIRIMMLNDIGIKNKIKPVILGRTRVIP